jgi:hypothetical protein
MLRLKLVLSSWVYQLLILRNWMITEVAFVDLQDVFRDEERTDVDVKNYQEAL